jgi:hypothetical protein
MCSASPASGPACDEEFEQRFESSTQRGGVGCDERGAGADVAHCCTAARNSRLSGSRRKCVGRLCSPLQIGQYSLTSNKLTSQLPQGCLRIHREDALIRVAVGVTRHASNRSSQRNDHTGGAGSVRDIGRRAVLPAQQGFDPAAQHEIPLVAEQLGRLLNTHQPRMLRARDQPRRVILGAQRTPLQRSGVSAARPIGRAWSTIRSTRSSA